MEMDMEADMEVGVEKEYLNIMKMKVINTIEELFLSKDINNKIIASQLLKAYPMLITSIIKVHFTSYDRTFGNGMYEGYMAFGNSIPNHANGVSGHQGNGDFEYRLRE